jgi:hypothetical protein
MYQEELNAVNQRISWADFSNPSDVKYCFDAIMELISTIKYEIDSMKDNDGSSLE